MPKPGKEVLYKLNIILCPLSNWFLIIGGLEEENAERHRWIKREHDKTMESVFALLKSRGENISENLMKDEEIEVRMKILY